MNNNALWTHSVFDVCDEMIWFVPYYANVLCGYSLKEKSLVKIVELRGTTRTNAGVFISKVIGDYVLCFPGYDEKVFLCRNGQVEKSYDVTRNIPSIYESYFQYSQYKNDTYVFPINYPYLIKVANNEDEPELEFVECKNQMIVSTCVVNSKVMFVDRTNTIKSFDMCNGKVEKVKVNSKRKEYRNITRINDTDLVVVDVDGNVDLLSLSGNIIRNVYDLGESFYSIVCVDGKLYMFSQNTDDKIVVLSTSDWKKEEILLEKGEYYKDWRGPAFSEPYVLGSDIYVMNTRHQCLYIIHTDISTVERQYILWTGNDKEVNNLLEIDLAQKITTEGETFYSSINNYIEVLSGKE